jgi:IS30 family transposase
MKRRKKYPPSSTPNKITNKISINDRPECNIVVERVTRLTLISKAPSQKTENTLTAKVVTLIKSLSVKL